MVLTLIGGLALAASAALTGSPGADSPGIPTSMVNTYVDHKADYCVTGYAPNGEVAVRNERTGATASIHTNNRGTGCADIPVEVSCGEVLTQTIVATGVGADGNPGTSSARATVPGTAPGCTANLAGDDRAISEGLSGTDLVALAGGGAAALALGGVGVVIVRRRRSAADD